MTTSHLTLEQFENALIANVERILGEEEVEYLYQAYISGLSFKEIVRSIEAKEKKDD